MNINQLKCQQKTSCDFSIFCVVAKKNVHSWTTRRQIKFTLISQLLWSCLIGVNFICKRRLKSFHGLKELNIQPHVVHRVSILSTVVQQLQILFFVFLFEQTTKFCNKIIKLRISVSGLERVYCISEMTISNVWCFHFQDNVGGRLYSGHVQYNVPSHQCFCVGPRRARPTR